MNKEKLIKHFKWLITTTSDYACGFTKEEHELNKQIYEILCNLKMEE